MHATTQRDAVRALADLFLPRLLKCEDFDAFEREVLAAARELACRAAALCVEAFDEGLRERAPRAWSAHERAGRSLATLLGRLEFSRTVFIDEFGRRRALADELLGLPARARLSTGAFLWMVRRAAEESYRKTAEAFEEATGCAVSHVTVMNCVRAEAGLLLDEPPGPGPKVSQEELFVEADGLWVRLQAPVHRGEALPRFLYEQARGTRSFELKIGVAYAGKRRVAPGRLERGGRVFACSAHGSREFWDRMARAVEGSYAVEDVRRVWLGADGAAWCGPEGLARALPGEVEVRPSLDPFHIMQKIWRAFPEGARRDWAVSLAVRRKAGALARMCERCAPKAAGRRRKRIEELGSYMRGNAAAVAFPDPSMGTMEGTNAHVGAARLKGQGRSWSKEGAEAVCLVRCALAQGRPLVAPGKGALFTRRESEAAARRGAASAGGVPEADGEGYAPPHQARTRAMRSAAGFRARTC